MGTLTVREVKNKVLASLPEVERRDALVGTVHNGDVVIVTEHRVFEVYVAGGRVYVSVKNTEGHWQEYDEHEGDVN